MPKLQLFCLYDQGARFFGAPMMTQNESMLRRGLEALLQDNPNLPIFQYSDDFIVYKIGEYDQESGEISPMIPAARIETVSTFMRKPGHSPSLDVTVPTDTISVVHPDDLGASGFEI